MVQKLKANFLQIIFFIFVFTIFFLQNIPNLILIVLLINAGFLILKDKINFGNFFEPSFFILLLFFIFKAILFWQIKPESEILSRYFIIILVPIVLVPFNVNTIKTILFTSIVVSVLLILSNVFWYYLQHHYLPFGNGMDVNKTLLIERPYLGFIGVLGVLLGLNQIVIYPKQKKLIGFSVLILVGFLIMIAARLSILSLIIIFFIYLFKKSKLSLLKKMVVVVVLFLLVILVFKNTKSLVERFYLNENLKTFIDNEPRFVIWDCAFHDVTSEKFNILTGNNSSIETQNNLDFCYESKIDSITKRYWYMEQKYNSHNQFLHFFLTGGITCLLLFFVFVFRLFHLSRHNFILWSIVLSLFFFYLLENVLQRQLGCYLSGLILGLLLKVRYEKN